MKTKQTVAIIGATGEMGTAIAKSITKGTYRILLQSLDINKVQSLIGEMKSRNPFVEVEAVDNPWDACWEADMIILAVPYSAEKLVAETVGRVVN